jgi:hypothetical protein
MRHRRLAIAALGVLALAVPLTRAAAEEAPAARPRALVTLDVDYSRKPLLAIDARGVTADELMRSLAREMGFDVRRLGTADPRLLVRGRFIGRLEDLLPWLLRHEDHVVVYGDRQADGSRPVAKVLLLSSRPEAAAAGEPAVARSVGAEEVRALLASRSDLNRDMRDWLAGAFGAGTAGAGQVAINLYDAPNGVTDLLGRLSEPLVPDFAARRLENRGPGTPPRHLTGANDAAQQDLASALARTTSLARQGAQALTQALGQVCLDPGCPGVTLEELRARARRLEDEARRPKPVR